MKKFSKSMLKGLINSGRAADITEYDHAEVCRFTESRRLDKIGYCSGTYGISGGLLQDRKTGELFAITKRNIALLTVF